MIRSNQEIIKELQTRGRFKTPEEVDEFFLKILEAKDKQHREEMKGRNIKKK